VKISNIKVDHHRNGVMGEPFSVATFDMEEDGEKRRMVGILFHNPGTCAVLDIGLLAQGDIEFGSNSWRGDRFEDELRKAVKMNQEA
jgi:hypothetical protein